MRAPSHTLIPGSLRLSALAALLAFAGCVGPFKMTGPKAPVPELNQETLIKAVEGVARMSEFKGYGEITMTAAGKKMTGKFDAVRKNTGSFSAQVYSPFGSSVASITAEDFRGRVNIGREQIDFTYDKTMKDVPFPCVGSFTYGRFVNVLTASVPDELWALSVTPYTLTQGKKWVPKKGRVAAVWSTDTLMVRATVFPKTGLIEQVTLDYDSGGSKLTMQFSRFKKGVPYEILIKESSKNYILVSYESITWK